jgi:hypothetical protein
MSRHGYVEFDGDDPLMEGRWRGAVRSALRGKRGQAFFRELIEALDAMPVKALAPHSFTRGGEVCALGSVALKRGVDVSEYEPADDSDEYVDLVDADALSRVFGIAPVMVREIMYENDECDQWHWEDDGSVVRHGVRHGETRKYRTYELPTERWQRMRAWAVRNLREQK